MVFRGAFILELLLVENLLRQKNVKGVAIGRAGSRHHGDDSVLFDIERAWVELKRYAKKTEALGWHNFSPETANTTWMLAFGCSVPC